MQAINLNFELIHKFLSLVIQKYHKSDDRVFVALFILLLLIASLFSIFIVSYNLQDHNDDTYITLTYAKSLVKGEGWRYNGGPETLGTTTPLFALVVMGLAYFLPAGCMLLSAVGFSTFCWLATGWLFFLGHKSFGLTRYQGAFVGISLLLQAGWWQRTFGMEATFLIFGLMLTVWIVARGHAFLGGMVSALLFLIRPEGLAMVPLAGAWLLWHQRATWRETSIRFGSGVLIPFILWGGYAYTTFGYILPNSAMAKLGQGASWPGKLFIERLIENWVPKFAQTYGYSSILSLLWPLVLTGVIGSIQRWRPFLLLSLWLSIFVTVYAYLQAPGYWWYIMPVFFVLYLLGLLGILFFLQQSTYQMKAVGVVACLLYLTITLQMSIKSVNERQADERAPTYLTVAEWLNHNTQPKDSVAFVEIGYLGYFTENRIIDLVGLVDPAYRDNGAEMNLASNFWQAEPDYFLYAPDFDWLLGPIVEDERFAKRYHMVTEIPSHFSTPLMIYKK